MQRVKSRGRVFNYPPAYCSLNYIYLESIYLCSRKQFNSEPTIIHQNVQDLLSCKSYENRFGNRISTAFVPYRHCCQLYLRGICSWYLSWGQQWSNINNYLVCLSGCQGSNTFRSRWIDHFENGISKIIFSYGNCFIVIPVSLQIFPVVRKTIIYHWFR